MAGQAKSFPVFRCSLMRYGNHPSLGLSLLSPQAPQHVPAGLLKELCFLIYPTIPDTQIIVAQCWFHQTLSWRSSMN